MTSPLPHLLHRTSTIELTPRMTFFGDLKALLRFWIGLSANKILPQNLESEFKRVFANPQLLRDGWGRLSAIELSILGVFKRYGGTMSGYLLLAELLARQWLPTEKLDSRLGYPSRENDITAPLRTRGILIPTTPAGYYGYWEPSTWPDQAVNPKLLPWANEKAPLPWPLKKTPSGVTNTRSRSVVGMVLDLSAISQTLTELAPWKINLSGALSKTHLNRLKKSIPDRVEDPTVPPQLEGLYYELLRGLGVVNAQEELGTIDLSALTHHFQCSAVEQAWRWVRSWMQIDLWQDGIGMAVKTSAGLQTTDLLAFKELLVWTLGRIALSNHEWLDLEIFLWDMLPLSGGRTHNWYWHKFSWSFSFGDKQQTAKPEDYERRIRQTWMNNQGNLFANMLMVTMVHLGLVEAGTYEVKSGSALCFRLTPLGKAVFATPDQIYTVEVAGSKCLTIQPNYDVMLFLDEATPDSVWLLPRFARRTSAPDNRVQTFALSRDSVYFALESGLTLEQITTFLQDQSKNGVPDNVARTLKEWGQKRDALAIHSDLALEIHPAEAGPAPQNARMIGTQFRVSNAQARRAKGDETGFHYPINRKDYWVADESGKVQVHDRTDRIALARLMQFAERIKESWHITEVSIRRARDRGINVDQILDWLRLYARKTPPIIETMIRNWLKPSSVFLDKVVLLQVQSGQVSRMLQTSERFKPFLLGYIPPDWFLVDPEQKKELEKELKQIGFKLGGDYQLASSSSEETEKE